MKSLSYSLIRLYLTCFKKINNSLKNAITINSTNLADLTVDTINNRIIAHGPTGSVYNITATINWLTTPVPGGNVNYQLILYYDPAGIAEYVNFPVQGTGIGGAAVTQTLTLLAQVIPGGSIKVYAQQPYTGPVFVSNAALYVNRIF